MGPKGFHDRSILVRKTRDLLKRMKEPIECRKDPDILAKEVLDVRNLLDRNGQIRVGMEEGRLNSEWNSSPP